MPDTPKGASQKRESGQARVAFLAKLDVIRADRDAGWALTTIYERHLAGVVSYPQFTRYVRRYLPRADVSAPQWLQPPVVVAPPVGEVQSMPSAVPASPPAAGAGGEAAAEPGATADSTAASHLDLDAIRSTEWDLDGLARAYRQQQRSSTKGGSK